MEYFYCQFLILFINLPSEKVLQIQDEMELSILVTKVNMWQYKSKTQ
jgi:hypothetical protein